MPSELFQQATDTNQFSDVRLILQRLDQIEHKLDEQLKDHENRLRALERQQAELEAKFTGWQALQATFTAVAASIAGLFGRQQ